MANPYAIQIHCDGAMNYDSIQTGGNGFIIEFPDSFELEPITGSMRNDDQGIHRLEMISIIEAMERLLMFAKQNPKQIREAAAVEIYTDRLKVTDGELSNPYKIRDWRKNGWKNYEGKEIKDKDLLDKIDKTRIKVGKTVGGSVSINFKPRKQNKIADKLSKSGKKSSHRGLKIFETKNRRVIRRLYDGPEVDYSKIDSDSIFEARVYAWEPVGERFEVCFEACSGDFEGRVIKAYVDARLKSQLHRGHFYLINIDLIFRHHIEIILLESDTR